MSESPTAPAPALVETDWLVVKLAGEEYARHVGHADILREAVDGRVGEDPPEDSGSRCSGRGREGGGGVRRVCHDLLAESS